LSWVTVPAFLLMTGSGAWASITLHADLSTTAETIVINPTTNPGALPLPLSFGTADFVLNDAQNAMTMTVTVHNIDFTGNQTPNDSNDHLANAHIHASATVTPTTTA